MSSGTVPTSQQTTPDTLQDLLVKSVGLDQIQQAGLVQDFLQIAADSRHNTRQLQAQTLGITPRSEDDMGDIILGDNVTTVNTPPPANTGLSFGKLLAAGALAATGVGVPASIGMVMAPEIIKAFNVAQPPATSTTTQKDRTVVLPGVNIRSITELESADPTPAPPPPIP